MKRINLIPAQRREASKTRRRVQRWVCACGAYAAAIVLTFVVLRVIRHDSTMLASEISRLAQLANDCQLAIDSITPQIAEKQAMLEAARAVADQPDWSVLLALLGKTIGDDVILNYCEVQPQLEKPAPPKAPLPPAVAAAQQAAAAKAMPGSSSYVIRIGGYAMSQKAVSYFVVRLEQSRLFDKVKLIKSDRSTAGDAATNFRVECTMGEGRDS